MSNYLNFSVRKDIVLSILSIVLMIFICLSYFQVLLMLLGIESRGISMFAVIEIYFQILSFWRKRRFYDKDILFYF
jgi:hypothetical protein